MAVILFSGDRLRALRQAIQLNTAGATIASGSADPTLVAPGISLSPGSIYLSTSTGRLYVKKTTTGDDTNFDVIPQLAAALTANRVVVTDASGNLVTDAELTYDATTDTFTVVNVEATDVTVDSLTANSVVKTDANKKLVSGQIVNADVDPAAAIELSKLEALTANRALQSDALGEISVSTVTSTELGYLSGVLSPIQTQIDGKVSKAGDTMTGELDMSANKIVDLADPTLAQDAATKNYVDTQDATKVSKAGDSMSGNLVMGGNLITSLGTPVADDDAATKGYVDSAINGLAWKNPVRALADTDQTLSGLPTIDGVPLVSGDRLLLIAQANPVENGIYAVDSGTWLRSTDFDTGAEASSVAVFVQEGNIYADTAFTCTSDNAQVGTDPLTFVQFTGAGQIIAGVGLLKTGNTLDVNLGAGISQLPTDQVGIDLFPSSGLMLTLDGINPSSDEDAQLTVRLDGTTLARSVDGLKVATNGITDNEVAPTAAIQRTKLAADTANTFAINDATGVLDARAVTANRAVATDINGLPVASATTDIELGYVSGVLSPIQTQLDGKANTALSNLVAPTAVNVDLIMSGNKVTDLGAPTNPNDAATKAYVDGLTGVTEFSDADFRIQDNVDPTKQLAFEVAAIATATTRTITMPDADVNLGLVATAIQRDGSVAFTADQSMGGFKLTNLADATLATDAVNLQTLETRTVIETDSLALTAGSTIPNSATHLSQVLVVQAASAGTTVLSTTPFGLAARQEGQIITVFGNSSTNVVQIDNANVAKGCIMNASWTGAQYDAITFQYSSTLDRFVEISRNN